MLAALPPASDRSVTGGKGARYRAAAAAMTSWPARGGMPAAARASASTRRAYGQRSRNAAAGRVPGPRLCPMIHARPLGRQAGGAGEPGSREGPGRGLERQPVCGLRAREVRPGDPEGAELEAPALEQCRSRAVGRVARTRIRVVVVGEVEPGGRDPAERSPAGEHGVEQGGRVIGVGEAAGEADDGDRLARGRIGRDLRHLRGHGVSLTRRPWPQIWSVSRKATPGELAHINSSAKR